MKIESLIRITGGVLQNTPSVLFVEDFQIESNKITRGCAFFDVNNSLEDVTLALENGAYAIFSTQKYEILDKEIAWIELASISSALTKLCRFLIQEKNITLVKLPTLHFELLNFIRLEVKTKILQQNIQSAFMQIIKASKKTLFISVENDFSNKIIPESDEFRQKVTPEKILAKSLFLSSFVYERKYINDLRVNSLFIPYFCALLEFLKLNNLSYEIVHFNEFEHFNAQFVDTNLSKKEFGASSKVLVFEKDEKLFFEELQYIKENKLEKSFLLCSFNKNFKYENFEHLYLQTPKDILQLRKRSFRYALILGEKEEFTSFFEEKKLQQLTLI